MNENYRASQIAHEVICNSSDGFNNTGGGR